jgi:TolB-like protein
MAKERVERRLTVILAADGKSVDLKEVGRDLGARYILEGSMRRAGQRVRITSQLIDTTTARISGSSATTEI